MVSDVMINHHKELLQKHFKSLGKVFAAPHDPDKRREVARSGRHTLEELKTVINEVGLLNIFFF